MIRHFGSLIRRYPSGMVSPMIVIVRSPSLPNVASPAAAAFPGTPVAWYYWTSSPYAGSSSYAWYVDFGYGFVGYNNRGTAHYVRLVR